MAPSVGKLPGSYELVWRWLLVSGWPHVPHAPVDDMPPPDVRFQVGIPRIHFFCEVLAEILPEDVPDASPPIQFVS